MSVEGPVISWVADHRKHHAYSDRLGDPHSPHVDHGGGWRGALRGLAHAHLGWLFDHSQRGGPRALRPRPGGRPGDQLRRQHLRAVVARGPRDPVRPRRADRRHRRARASRECCGEGWRASSCCTTSPTASTRCAISSAAGASRPAITRATCCGWPRSPSGRPGTTTTMPSRPRPSTDWAAASSTSRGS